MKILLKLFSLKFISALLGVLYSILQVRYFGASRTIEIYFAAQSLVYLVTSLTQSGQLAEIFLPEYHKLNAIEPKLGFQGLNVVLNRMLLWGLVIIVFVFALAPLFISLLIPGFTSDDQEQATFMFRVLVPYLFIQVISAFFITVLNAESLFGRSEFLGLTNSLLNIVILIIFYPKLGIWALVISLLLGKLVEFAFYIWQLYSIGFQYHWKLMIPEFNHISYFKTMKNTILYVGATQFYSFILTASISFLPTGTFAIFKYVQNLANKVQSLLISPFMTVFFTQYSNLLQQSKSLEKQFQKYFTSIININIITLLTTILLGDYFINYLWGGKKFDISYVQLAYVFFIFNILGVFINSLGGIYRKMAIANGEGKRLYFLWVFAQLFSGGLSFLLIKYFQIGGLYVIIPLNILLLSVPSFWVYKKTVRSLSYDFMNKKNIVSFILILIALYIKLNGHFLIHDSYEWKGFLLMLSLTICLSLFPLLNTYKVFKV